MLYVAIGLVVVVAVIVVLARRGAFSTFDGSSF